MELSEGALRHRVCWKQPSEDVRGRCVGATCDLVRTTPRGKRNKEERMLAERDRSARLSDEGDVAPLPSPVDWRSDFGLLANLNEPFGESGRLNV